LREFRVGVLESPAGHSIDCTGRSGTKVSWT
jgi:hypothetical protein